MADDKSESAKSGLTDADLVLDDEAVEDREVKDEDSEVVQGGATMPPKTTTLE